MRGVVCYDVSVEKRMEIWNVAYPTSNENSVNKALADYIKRHKHT